MLLSRFPCCVLLYFSLEFVVGHIDKSKSQESVEQGRQLGAAARVGCPTLISRTSLYYIFLFFGF